MDGNLRELSELLRRGQKRSGQLSFRRRAPADAAAPYLRQARNGFRMIVEAQSGNAEAWRLLSQAEEALLGYRHARIALERAIALESRPNRHDLKKLALLREYEAWWDGLGLTPDQLSELQCYLEKTLTASPCNHTMRHTKAWLDHCGRLNAGRIREALERRGGYCDCEVLHNVARCAMAAEARREALRLPKPVVDEAPLLPEPPKLGPPVSWFHGVWITAPDDEPVEWFDELDAEHWSIRCVRKFRDGSLKAHSYASPDWRHEMPEVPIPPLEEINDNPDFAAKDISKAEFEVVWEMARRAMAG